MQKIVASFLDDEGNLQFTGQDGSVLFLETQRKQSGEPPPADDHWYKDGEGIDVYFGARKTTTFDDLQVLRIGRYLHGSLVLSKSDVKPGERLRLVFDDPKELLWRYAGLVPALYGWATYRNTSGKDAFIGHSMWDDPETLFFEFPERNDPWRFRSLAGKYPENWGHYGLILEWGIGVF